MIIKLCCYLIETNINIINSYKIYKYKSYIISNIDNKNDRNNKIANTTKNSYVTQGNKLFN